MIERAIRDYLKTSDTVRDAAPGGCWPGKSPKGKRGDRLIIRQISGERFYDLDNEIDRTDATVQIDAYATTADDAKDLFELVRNMLSGYRGTAGDLEVQGTRIINERATEEEPENSSDKWTHRYSADFALFYNSATPTHA